MGRKRKVDIEKMKQMHAEGKAPKEIANLFGVKTTTVRQYLSRIKREAKPPEVTITTEVIENKNVEEVPKC